MNRILFIDDDQELGILLTRCLETEGYQVHYKQNGPEGLHQITLDSYQLLILDMMMPGMDGMTVLTRVREFSNIPVLLLTAKGDEMDKVIGLRSGADDYMTKPFHLSELTARVHSLIRRFTVLGSGSSAIPSSYTYGGLTIEPTLMRATYHGVDLQLTSKEYDLLFFLASHAGQVFTKKQIYRNVWNEEYAYDDNNIMVHIRRLRKKIEPDPQNPIYILTQWGMGYKFSGVNHHDK